MLATITPASAKNDTPGVSIPVVSANDPDGGFEGTFTILRFVATRDGVNAVGVLSGVATPKDRPVTSVYRTLVVPVAVNNAPSDALSTAVASDAVSIAATCDILHLDLGPLALDLLGLQIDLSRIILDITAQTGAGNLLGNLLCAVTGLLDSPGGLARILNQILGILG
jgi:hypothetical protein